MLKCLYCTDRFWPQEDIYLWLPYFKCLYCTDRFWPQADKYVASMFEMCALIALATGG